MKRSSFFYCLFFFVAYLTLSSFVSAATLHVPSQYTTIQDAINNSNNGDTVIIDPNTYTGPGNCDIDFGGRAITVRSIDPNDPDIVAATVIDCNGTELDPHRGFKFHSGEGDDSILAGLTIINGYAPNDGSYGYAYGGGISCGENTYPTIVNCVITNCQAWDDGGGIYADYPSNITVINSTISKCKALRTSYGNGGISCDDNATIRHCTITQNSGSNTGGIYIRGGTVLNCIITDNTSFNYGGVNCSNTIVTGCKVSNNDGIGLHCRSNSLLSNCIIYRNTSSGVWIDSESSTLLNCTVKDNKGKGISVTSWNNSVPVIESCSIVGNLNVGVYCSGVAGVFRNCIISENGVDGYGGGIHCIYSDSMPEFINCTITGNSATYGGAICSQGATPSLTNCILWKNSAIFGSEIAIVERYGIGSLSISNSDIQGGQPSVYIEEGSTLNWGTGNIDADPNFAFTNDFRLMYGSPCIDSGNGSDTIVFTDTTIANGTTTSIVVANASIYDIDDEVEYDNDGILRTVTNVNTASNTLTFDNSLPLSSQSGKSINNYGWGDFEGKDRILDATVDMGAFESDGSKPSIASSESFDFFMSQGGPSPNNQTLLLRNNGTGTLIWNLTSDSVWLQAIHASGTSSGEVDQINLSVDANDLPHGDHVCNLTVSDINASNSPRTIEVLLHVNITLLVPSEYSTIQEAIDAAIDGDTVLVADGTYTGYGNKDLEKLGKRITVQSENGPDTCTIDCENEGRGFYFHFGEDANSIVDGFTITDANSNSYGGIYFNNGNPSITNCAVIDNNCSGIYCYRSNPYIYDCTVKNNSASNGGGIHCQGRSNPIISNCTIQENFTIVYGAGTGYGGGIYCSDSSPRIIECEIINNTSVYNGGGLYIIYENSSPTIANCFISNNSAGSQGSAVYSDESSPEFDNCTITENSPDNWATTIYGNYGNISFSECNISGNYAAALRCYPGTVTLNHCTITGNDGSGITLTRASGEISDCVIAGNRGRGVGMSDSIGTITSCYINCNNANGIYLVTDSTATISNCRISGNSDSSGPSIYVYWGCTAVVDHSVIVGNDATSGGGGICTIGRDANTTVNNCTIAYNSAGTGGGVYASVEGQNHVANSILWNNISNFGPEIYVGGSSSQPCYVSIGYSDVKDGVTGAHVSEYGTLDWQEGNIELDPNFVINPESSWTGDGTYDPNRCQITLLDNTALWTEDELAGMFVNPDTTQNRQFPIVSNDSNSITVWADWDTVEAAASWATNGSSYQIYDYHLQSEAGRWDLILNDWVIDVNTSRCIDAGNPGSPLGAEPNDTNNLRINMGAYGGTTEASKTPSDWSLLADLTNDGLVNLGDFAGQSADWQEAENDQPGDLDRNGIVNLADTTLLAEDWLQKTIWSQP